MSKERLTGTKMKGRIDYAAARELFLFIQNDRELYRQEIAIDANLKKKLKRGVFNRSLAVKLFMYLAEAGATKYAEQAYGLAQRYGRGGNPEYATSVRVAKEQLGLNTKTRFAVAAMLTKYWIDAYQASHGVHINPLESQRKPCSECGHPWSWHFDIKYVKGGKTKFTPSGCHMKGHKPCKCPRYDGRYRGSLADAGNWTPNPVSKRFAHRITAAALREAERRGYISNPGGHVAFDVYFFGKKIDTVYYALGFKIAKEEVKRSLVEHDGYDYRIVVRRRKGSLFGSQR
jgi:hypothetical protein